MFSGEAKVSAQSEHITTGAAPLVTVQEARIASCTQANQERWQQGAGPNLIHSGLTQIGFLQTNSFTAIKEQYTHYKPNKEDEERGNLILNNPELFYQPTPWGMLPKTNPHFVGREEKLNELKTSFNQANQSAAVVINQRRLHRQAANREQSQASADKTAQGVLGLGGVGKTQLAAEYVYTLLDAEEDKPANTTPLERQYALIVWLRGQRILLEQDLRELATWVGLLFEPNAPMKQIAQALYARLAKLSRLNQGQSRPRVLWIVDDAHWEDSLQELLPQPQQAYQGCFHWLLTSREQQPWKKYFGETFKPCVLGVFTKKEAQFYLDTALKSEVKQQVDYTENCQWLMKQMGQLPLALAQAAAYINQSRSDNALAEYCRLFQARGEELAGIGVEEGDERTVLTTWLITLSALLTEETLAQGQGGLAIYLLLNCAYCDGASIPVELLTVFQFHQEASHRPSEVQIENAVRYLVNYSLVTRLEDGSIQVHQLVQQVLCWWMGRQLSPQSPVLTKNQSLQVSELESDLQKAHIDKEQVLSVLVENLIRYASKLVEKPDIKAQMALAPHLTTLIGYWQTVNEKTSNKESQEKMALLYFYLGSIQYVQGYASASKTSYQHALAFLQQCYPKGHPSVAATLSNLGTAYGALGDAFKKRSFIECALVVLESHYGKDHYQVAATLINLGNAYGDLGDASKQKELLERALAIQEAHYGKDHYQVAITLANLGNAYGDLGDAFKKKVILERTLAIQEAHYGKDHYQVAITLANLGNAYGDLGDASKQKALLERALIIQEAYYGKDHYQVARTFGNLGNAYGALGDPLKQKAFLERALVIKEAHYGKDHYEVAKTLNNLGTAYGKLGDALKQKAILERALIIKEAHYGKDHYEIAITLVNLVVAELLLGHPQIALTKARHCLQIFQASFGEFHQHTKTAQNLIKKCEQDLQASPSLSISEEKKLLDEKKALLQARHHISLEDTSLQTYEKLFRCAAVEGELAVVKDCLKNLGVSIDSQDTNPRNQRTALHWACLKKRESVIAYLVEQGARFDIADSSGKLAWEYVAGTPLLRLFQKTSGGLFKKYAIQTSPDWGKLLRMAVVNDCLADVRYCVEVLSIDINSADNNPNSKRTPLHWAAIKIRPAIAHYLLNHGAQTDLADFFGKTASIYAQETENNELLAVFSLDSNKAGRAVWYQLVPGEKRDFHYVYLHSAYQIQLQNIIEGDYGRQSPSSYPETFAEGNDRLPMQIGFKTKEAALELLNELNKAIVVNKEHAGLLRV